MKKRILSLLLVLTMIVGLLPSVAFAAESIVDSGTCGYNLTWELNSEGTLTISGTGEMDDYGYVSEPWWESRDLIKTVIVCEGVSNIGESAFAGCKNLENVEIPKSVEFIGRGAFLECANIKKIVIPDGVKTIEMETFSCCVGLEDITIPDSVTVIKAAAFNSCNSLENIILPDGLEVVEDQGFHACADLKNIEIPDSVVSIGKSAFWSCGLSKITIPSNVTYIGRNAFVNCEKLAEINVAQDNITYASLDGVLYNKARTELIAYPEGKGDSFEIPDGVEKICEDAFYWCEDLKSVSIPDSVKVICRGAFLYCSGLTDILIPDGVTTIENGVFMDCSKLATVTIPRSVAHVNYGAFSRCTNLMDVYYAGNEEEWKAISVDNTHNDNDCLLNATIHFNSTGGEVEKPTDSLKLVSQYPKSKGVFTGDELKVSMTFNYDIESVKAGISFDEDNNTVIHGNFLIARQIEESDNWKFETVYSLQDGDNAETDVTIDGKTVTIDASEAELIPGETYYVLMDNGVISFKDTEEQIGFAGTQWTFIYQPTISLNGFTLGKHNNSFLHESSGERAGFKGVKGHKLSWEKYVDLIDDADVLDKLKITLQVMSSDWNGSCYGIASTMLLAYANELNLSRFANGINRYYDMPLPCENKDFLESIEYFHLSQSVVDYKGAKSEEIEKLLPELIYALKSNPVLFSYKHKEGGHAILALDYTEDEEGNYLIWMYDMNSYYSGNCGVFTLFQIAEDFSEYSLTLPNGNILEKNDLHYIQFSTIDQLNAVNPYLDNRSVKTSERFQTVNLEADDVIVITVPMSETAYTIENSIGEKLICDANGHFSGTMELLNVDGFFLDENDGSMWELTVKHADSFYLSNGDNSVDIAFYTNKGCLGIKSDGIDDITFVINDSIVIEEDVQANEYSFTTFLSNNMVKDNDVRIVQASALANGQTVIRIDKNQFLMSATEKMVGKELVLIDSLNRYPLTDLDESDNVIETDICTSHNTGTSGGGLSAGGDKSNAGADKLGNEDKAETTAPEETPVVTPSAPAGFTDLSGYAWAADAIANLVDKGIIKGTSATTYSPAANITRADFAALLVRLFKLTSANEENFADVNASDYFAAELAVARNTGIVNGIGDNKFAPRSNITRQDMMVMIYRAMTTLGIELAPADENIAADFGEVSDYAKEAVAVLMANGIITGKNGNIDPTAYATRAEVAVMLSRVLELIK